MPIIHQITINPVYNSVHMFDPFQWSNPIFFWTKISLLDFWKEYVQFLYGQTTQEKIFKLNLDFCGSYFQFLL